MCFNGRGWLNAQPNAVGKSEEANSDGCATYPMKIRREEILSTRLSDFKEFTSAIDAIEDKGAVMAIASSDDIETASLNDFEVKARSDAHKKLRHAHMFLEDVHICSNEFDDKA
ncbi:hypothetical protein Tco_0348175 [Tanacetum coccineum]